MVPERGLEPPCLATLAPETSASTNSAIRAFKFSEVKIPSFCFSVKMFLRFIFSAGIPIYPNDDESTTIVPDVHVSNFPTFD